MVSVWLLRDGSLLFNLFVLQMLAQHKLNFFKGIRNYYLQFKCIKPSKVYCGGLSDELNLL